MTDDGLPFYAPDKRLPKREPQPGELLYEFTRPRDAMVIRCELRDRGEWGVEAQIFQGAHGLIAQMFRPALERGKMLTARERAIAWAEGERRALEE